MVSKNFRFQVCCSEPANRGEDGPSISKEDKHFRGKECFQKKCQNFFNMEKGGIWKKMSLQTPTVGMGEEVPAPCEIQVLLHREKVFFLNYFHSISAQWEMQGSLLSSGKNRGCSRGGIRGTVTIVARRKNISCKKKRRPVVRSGILGGNF